MLIVPDQYSFRTEISLQFPKIVLTAGLRYEKVTEDDLFDGNRDFQRAASITSVERR